MDDGSDHERVQPAGDPSETRATSSAAATFASVQRLRIVVRKGPDAGSELTTQAERTVIGTHPSSSLVLTDPTVSRFHCEIVSEGDRMEVRDLGSRNGTLVNDVSIVRAYLPRSGVMRLGHTELLFEPRSDPVRVPLSTRESFGRMVGRSTEMRRVFSVLERAASGDATVLIEGETGTGKEVAAESIHLESARKDGPFVVVDCSAVPAELLESELFGHERGAFTGATGTREGAFVLADGGTIFLDEIGELALDLQPKLLRALERREVKRVGGSKFAKVDVRVIAATNRNLRTEVNEKRFRSDLYYRLAVVEVRLPPLRERADDLPVLVERLLESLEAADRPDARALRDPAFLAGLARHPWPGNVRELRNYVDRCLALRETVPLEPPDPAELDDDGGSVDVGAGMPFKLARDRWSRAFERKYLTTVLAAHAGNVSAAARAAGLDRMYFYRLLWRHGLR